MKCDIIAYLDTLIDGSIRIDDTVVADMYVVAYYSMRVNLTTVTDYTSLANAGEWSDITVLTNLCCFCDVCLRGYTCLLWLAGFIYLKKLGNTLVRILYTYESGFDRLLQLHVFVYYNNRRFCVIYIVRILWIRQE